MCVCVGGWGGGGEGVHFVSKATAYGRLLRDGAEIMGLSKRDDAILSLD